MLGIGFFELMLVLVIAILVFSPERLPELIRWGLVISHRAKRMWRNVCDEVESSVDMADIKQTLYNDDVMNRLNKESNHSPKPQSGPDQDEPSK